MGSTLRTPIVRSSEEDVNRDGVNDIIRIAVSVPLFPGEVINRVTVAAFLDVTLSTRAKVKTVILTPTLITRRLTRALYCTCVGVANARVGTFCCFTGERVGERAHRG